MRIIKIIRRYEPAMSRRVHICAVLNLDSFLRRLDEAPELFLQVVLGNLDVANLVGNGAFGIAGRRRMPLEPHTTELIVAGLEA